MYKYAIFLSLFFSVSANAQTQPTAAEFDVCVYGGTSAGVIAAYTAAQMQQRVILIEPSNRLGGLSTGGLGFTDIGNKYVVTGLAHDFYRRVGQYYGKLEQWTFEPKVALSIFEDYVKRGGFTVLYERRLKRVLKQGTRITAIELEHSSASSSGIIKAGQFIDCTYEGDLMAMAGVSYTTGREANSVYKETVNGVQLKNQHQFPDGVDPYKVPGDPGSSLLWGISPEKLAPAGSGDKKIQAYNFRLCLTNDPENRLPVIRPAYYDSTHYELLLRYLAKKPSKDLKAFLKIDLMPNHKTDINNNGPFSTDMIGMNYNYPDGDYATREVILRAHEDYTKGLLYFIGHDPRMPANLREDMLQWGYPKDEYLNTNHWSRQLYVREARRMAGAYIMTQANCQGEVVVDDGIGMGAYNMDSHNAERIVVNGMVKNEGDVQQRGISPYPIAYRSITPKADECTNLLVPVCLSASHIAYGSIRMEPVFMVLAQSAAVAAVKANQNKTTVQNVAIRQLQAELNNNPLADHSIPEVLVDNDVGSDCVKKTGGWKRERIGGFGPSYLVDTSGADASVRFIPEIRHAGDYRIYIYFPKIQNSSTTTHVKIYDGKSASDHVVHNKDLQVIGQTSGDWVSVGRRHFTAGKRAYVEISGQGADGTVVADAVLFIPEK